jgi:hypothetical protein
MKTCRGISIWFHVSIFFSPVILCATRWLTFDHRRTQRITGSPRQQAAEVTKIIVTASAGARGRHRSGGRQTSCATGEGQESPLFLHPIAGGFRRDAGSVAGLSAYVPEDAGPALGACDHLLVQMDFPPHARRGRAGLPGPRKGYEMEWALAPEARALVGRQFLLHFFQRESFSFRVDE